jgi:hypothetical protein
MSNIPFFPQSPTGHLTKQQAFDYVEWCRKQKTPIVGLEVVKKTADGFESSIYKTVWFKTQRAVYTHAKNFIQKQMAGEWLWVEFKHN